MTRILITGDYWQDDFKELIGECPVDTTLVTLDKFHQDSEANLAFTIDDPSFDLIVVGQSRQGQYDQATINQVRAFAGTTPIVMLLGSWCEGELRSDSPVQGVKRVFWHQWRGRFRAFVEALANEDSAVWHSPVTETQADGIVAANAALNLDGSSGQDGLTIGVSAWNVDTYDVLSEAVKTLGWNTYWIERSSSADLSRIASAVCVDANSFDDSLERRLAWLKDSGYDAPIVVAMNFPRADEVRELSSVGVHCVVSKPFELNDLKTAIINAIGQTASADNTHSPVPAPKLRIRDKV